LDLDGNSIPDVLNQVFTESDSYFYGFEVEDTAQITEERSE
jgi:hypothetical protein